MSATAESSSQRTLAFVALLAGAAAIAFSPIFVRLADVSPTASAFWRVALAIAPLWLWIACSRRERAAAPRWRALALAGVFFAGDLGVWHLSIAYTSVANSAIEANLAPIFVTLGAWLLWHERFTRLFLAALAATLLGAALLIGPNVNLGGRGLLGDALGVLTAVFYAAYMLAVKSATRSASTARIMAISTTVAAGVLAPYALVTADVMLPQDARGWLVLAGLALVSQVAGQSLIAYGFAHLPASFSSVSLLLQPVLAALYAWAILGEGMGAVQMAGAAVVLAGIWLARRGS
jgi:drug/metabolite transporter (DMT)-like permease